MNETGEMIKSFKTSKAGKLKLVEEAGNYKTVRQDESDQVDVLQTVFENGVITREYTFEDIRTRAKQSRESEQKKLALTIN